MTSNHKVKHVKTMHCYLQLQVQLCLRVAAVLIHLIVIEVNG